jgi:serine/threonine protein kinase
MLPDFIDRYQIQSEIARGGMAIIYLAYDPQYDRHVAIKVLPREYLYYPQFRARFQREIEIMISIRHPGIVPIYGYGQFQGQLYLVMRYMEGGSLEDYIDSQGTLSLKETATLVEQIAPILESAHAQGVIHRDLKPSNILFDDQGQPFIADFGIARLTEQSNIAALTGKALIGSPAYMSPEQGRIGITVDGRSDVYSLGVMIFEMLTGQLPYQAESPMKLVLKHIMDPTPDILAVNPRLPVECKLFIQKAMAKDPEQRFSNAIELSSALASLGRAERRPSKPPAVPSPADNQIPDREKIQKQGSTREKQRPHLRPPRLSLPLFMYSFTRRFSRLFKIPASLRRPAVGYITLPPFLGRILGSFGLPTTVSLPTNKIWWVIGFIVLVIAVGVLCIGIFSALSFLIRLQAGHATATSFMQYF